MNKMRIFNYENNEVRMIEQDGEPWWVLADVCKALGITNYRNVSQRLDDDEKGVHQMDTLGGFQKVSITNESGLYKVILRSDKPEAKKFTRWITHEVLPSIRKTGGYGNQLDKLTEVAAQLTQTTTIMIQAAAKMMETVDKLGQRYIEEPQTRQLAFGDFQFVPFEKVCIAPAKTKLETFPPEIVSQVDEMLSSMIEQQNLNFSAIARFCIANGYAISNPAVKTYFNHRFSHT